MLHTTVQLYILYHMNNLENYVAILNGKLYIKYWELVICNSVHVTFWKVVRS